MKKVLIALDHGDAAQKIAELGCHIAKSLNAETILLHVVSAATYYSTVQYSPIMGIDNFGGLVAETDDAFELNKVAKEFLNHTKLFLGDDAIKTMLKSGDVTENILSAAKDLQVDMIVMGTHNKHGIDKILLGSVAEKVLHHSTIPLLIIPLKKD